MRSALRLPLAAAAFIALADTAIVALALPPILRELDTDVAGVAAVLGVYAVVLAVSLPLAEAARARLGTRTCGCAGVLCSRWAPWSAAWPERSSCCSPPGRCRPRAERRAGDGVQPARQPSRRARRAWRLAALLGFAAGPALGGALTQGFGWRSIFLLQAPAALAALPAVLERRPGATGPRHPSLASPGRSGRWPRSRWPRAPSRPRFSSPFCC